MTPTMQKILEEFSAEFGCPEYKTTHYLPNGKILSKGKVSHTDIKKFIQKACITYAKESLPSFILVPYTDEEYESSLGYNGCINAILLSIQQDSLDLPTN